MKCVKNFLENCLASLSENYGRTPVEKNHYTGVAGLELEKKLVSRGAAPKFAGSQGVQPLTLYEAAETCPTAVRFALEKIISRPVPPEHKFFVRAKTESANAFFVRVPKGTEAKVKLELPESKRGEFPAVFTIFWIEEGATAKILEKQSLTEGLISTEVFCGRDSRAEFVSINDSPVAGKERALISQKRFFIQENARAEAYSSFLGGGLVKAETEMVLEGGGSSSRDAQAAFPSQNQHFDLSSTAKHEAPSTKAHSIVKSVLMDGGRAVLWGRILISKGAKLADSFLSQAAVMLNSGARADAMPVLEIEENDVRATHASSVSHVDENALFYLNSRGIDSTEAKKTIASSLLESAFEKSTLEEAKSALEKQVELKWPGDNF